ncbi:MAG: hypothetical protein WCC14_14425 [Acidobacteriaceae bacterium]
MVTTKYSPINVGLVLLGLLLAVVNAWVAEMTTAFGADPVHGFKTGAIMVMLIASMALAPVSLITFRWPTPSVVASWTVALLCVACLPFTSVAILFLIIAVLEALIAMTVKSRSEETSGALTIRPS